MYSVVHTLLSALFCASLLPLDNLVDAAHSSPSSSHARRSLSLKNRDSHSNEFVARDGFFGAVLGELQTCMEDAG